MNGWAIQYLTYLDGFSSSHDLVLSHVVPGGPIVTSLNAPWHRRDLRAISTAAGALRQGDTAHKLLVLIRHEPTALGLVTSMQIILSL